MQLYINQEHVINMLTENLIYILHKTVFVTS